MGNARRSLVILGIAVAACGAPTGPRSSPATASARQQEAAADVPIAPARAEVWGWEADVGGALPAPLTCSVDVDGHRAPARVDGLRWSARVRLHPGTSHVRASCVDARGAIHASAVATLDAMLRDAPTARARVAIAGGEVRLDGAASAPSEGTPSPIASYAWTAVRGGEATAIGDAAAIRVAPPRDGEAVTYRLVVRDALGRTDASAVRVVVAGGRAVAIDARGDAWEEARDAIVYGVVPRLYGAPPLRAVTRALPDLADLGVTAIWLSPIFETLPGEYGYAVTDYLRVRPDYGTEDDARALVGEAHRLGLRVLLDLVPNHTSTKHRYFEDAEALGRPSHYYGFYERDASGAPVHYFDWAHLPNLAYANDEVARWMLAVSAHWMRDFAVDGFRVDAAWGIRQRAPGFWDAFRGEVRRVDPDAILVAEASARDPFYVTHGFDAAYDWTEELGHAAWEHVFDDPARIAERLDAAVRASGGRALRFLENNDTGERFVTRHGVDVTRVATAALLTLPGLPALFTGEERGAEYDPYARVDPLDPGDPHALRPWTKSLVAIRRATRALRGEAYARATSTPDDGRVSAYVRRGDGEGDVALVVLRWSDRASRARIAAPGGARAWRDLVSGRTFGADHGAIAIDLAPWAVHVLVPR